MTDTTTLKAAYPDVIKRWKANAKDAEKAGLKECAAWWRNMAKGYSFD